MYLQIPCIDRAMPGCPARAGWGGRYDMGCYEYDTRSSGTASLAYDAAGSLTSDGDKLYEYDAVGRLTYAASNANTNVELARYAYDALGRLAMQITYDYQQDAADPYDQLNTTRYFYYDTPDVGGLGGPSSSRVGAGDDPSSDRPILPQVIEQRDGDGDVTDQFIWGPAYVDELLTHDRDTDGDGGVDQRLYATHDRLYSVLSLVDEDGQATEHYEYSPYGADPLDARKGFASITDADTALPLSAEMSAAQYLYTGRSFDKAIGLNHHRARRLSHNLGRWNRQDPLGVAERFAATAAPMGGGPLFKGISPMDQYRDGANVYEYVGGRATASHDPSGLAIKTCKTKADIGKRRCVIDGFCKVPQGLTWEQLEDVKKGARAIGLCSWITGSPWPPVDDELVGPIAWGVSHGRYHLYAKYHYDECRCSYRLRIGWFPIYRSHGWKKKGEEKHALCKFERMLRFLDDTCDPRQDSQGFVESRKAACKKQVCPDDY